jgi:hypothetical protein
MQLRITLAISLAIAFLGASATLGAEAPPPAKQIIAVAEDPCIPDDITLCLHGGRFAARVQWTLANGTTGMGHAVPLNDGSGTFWFFSQDNSEMLIKVVNACTAPFEHYWVFYAATTDVGLSVTVADTAHSTAVIYGNNQGHAAAPVQDTQAFDTCP